MEVMLNVPGFQFIAFSFPTKQEKTDGERRKSPGIHSRCPYPACQHSHQPPSKHLSFTDPPLSGLHTSTCNDWSDQPFQLQSPEEKPLICQEMPTACRLQRLWAGDMTPHIPTNHAYTMRKWVCVNTRTVSLVREANTTDACGFPPGPQTLTSLSPKRKYKTQCLAQSKHNCTCRGNFERGQCFHHAALLTQPVNYQTACWTLFWTRKSSSSRGELLQHSRSPWPPQGLNLVDQFSPLIMYNTSKHSTWQRWHCKSK